jgi:hydrogenase nickel incorporation protein HypA/HybF
MHEYSIMVDIVKAALDALDGHDVENVESVFLDVGELMFLNPDQMHFCYKVLTEDNILKGSDLVIEEKKAQVECTSCGYKGELENRPTEGHHRLPSISCSRCGGGIDLLSGRECILKNIRMNVRDEGAGDQPGQ